MIIKTNSLNMLIWNLIMLNPNGKNVVRINLKFFHFFFFENLSQLLTKIDF